MRTRAEVRALRRAEARRYARFDAVVTVSSEDSAALAQAWGGMRGRRPPLFVSRNGVDAAAFDMAAAGGTHGAIGFVGGLTHPPNADAIRELRERVEPALPESIERVLIAGDRTDELAPSGRLRGLGLVDDVRSVYRDVLLSLAPIRWGSGTRLKIIESVAARRPVVAYPEAAEGLEDLVATGAVRLVGSPEEMAVAAGDLVADPDERLRVAELGRSVVVEHYDWGVTLAGVLAAVEAVTSGGRR
jgi:glycosyltransferase involved in cell wall biosynthesis